MTQNTDYGTPPSGPAALPPPAPPETPVPVRQLHRSRRDRVIAGVCGGLAEYFGVDVVLLRIVAVALALCSGAGVLLYVVAWIVVPEDPASAPAAGFEPEPEPGPEPRPGTARSRAAATTVAGAVLVAVGGLLLLDQLLPWVDAAVMWPFVVIAGGIAVLMSGRRRP